MLSSNIQRFEAFSYLRDVTCEALAEPAVQDRLGERGKEITSAFDTAFPIERHLGRLMLPQDQLNEDNIGIHPLVRSDLTLPNPYHYLSNPAPDSATSNLTKMSHGSIRGTLMYPFILASHIEAAAICLPKKSTLKPSELPRSLILVSPWVHKASPPVTAAIMAHEVDHALAGREATASANPDLDIHGDPYKTALERRAYPISALILEGSGAMPHDISADGLANMMRGLPPEAAATQLMKFGRKYVKSKSMDELRIKGIASHAYGAMALTAVFGNGSPMPTTDEVTAYKTAGLIH